MNPLSLLLLFVSIQGASVFRKLSQHLRSLTGLSHYARQQTSSPPTPAPRIPFMAKPSGIEVNCKPWLVYELLAEHNEVWFKGWLQDLEREHPNPTSHLTVFHRLLEECTHGACDPLRWMLEVYPNYMIKWWTLVLRHSASDAVWQTMREVKPFNSDYLEQGMQSASSYQILVPHHALIRKYAPEQAERLIERNDRDGVSLLHRIAHPLQWTFRHFLGNLRTNFTSILIYLYTHKPTQFAKVADAALRQSLNEQGGHLNQLTHTWQLHDPVAFFAGFAQLEGPLQAKKLLLELSKGTMLKSLLERINLPWLKVFKTYLTEAEIRDLPAPLRLQLLLFPEVQSTSEFRRFTAEHQTWIMRSIEWCYPNRPAMQRQLTERYFLELLKHNADTPVMLTGEALWGLVSAHK